MMKRLVGFTQECLWRLRGHKKYAEQAQYGGWGIGYEPGMENQGLKTRQKAWAQMMEI
jgi:hypothetical protein